MRTELFTVSRIFTESLFRIPDYQRGYSWGDDQLKDFWLDLEQLPDDGKHYTGVLTLEVVPDFRWQKWDDDVWIIKSRRYKPYYVVDGQQRLTTVIILLQAILEASVSDSLNYTARTDVQRKYIFDSKPEDSARSYIFGYEKDNPSYEFLKKNIFMEVSNVHSPDEETIYTKNLNNAKSFFKERISQLNKQDLESIYTKITQQLVFNVYEITSDIDVFVTFETMNNRGKPLSTLELLKNRLIYLSTKISAPEGRETNLRKTVNESWKAAYHFLGKNDDRQLSDDDFLQTHLSVYYLNNIKKYPMKDEDAKNRARKEFYITTDQFGRFLLNDLFTPKRIQKKNTHSDLPDLTREFIFEFSSNLKKSVELYFRLSTPSESKFSDTEKILLERIGRLKGHNPSGLLMALFQIENKSEKRERALEAIDRYLFLESISTSKTGYFPFSLHRRYYGHDFLLQYASGHLSTDELITLFENSRNELFKESTLSEVLHDWVKGTSGYYGWRAIRYFLFEYELHLQQTNKSNREKISWTEFSKENYKDDFQSIEHIYPQKAKDKYWTERFSKFTPKQKNLLRNSLGNLLAIDSPRNSSLSNRPFPEKRGDDNFKTGYRYGSYSENEISAIDDWNADQILERGIKLLTFLEKKWDVTIGERHHKIRALGLDFLERSTFK